MLRRVVIVVVGLLALVAASKWFYESEGIATLETAAPYYAPYKDSLYRALRDNDFAHAFTEPEDLPILRERFSWLEEHSTKRAKVVALIHWIDENMKHDEVMTVRAVEILEAGTGACEINAFAAGVLAAFDVRARWIGTVKSALGFGYLEVYVEGGWELFRIRSGREDPGLGKTAWDLYTTEEPSLSIRNFWHRFWKGGWYPVILPFANVQEHPELEVVFRTDRGLTDLSYRFFNPYDYAYTYFVLADDEWTREERVYEKFQEHMATDGMRITRRKARYINWLNLTKLEEE